MNYIYIILISIISYSCIYKEQINSKLTNTEVFLQKKVKINPHYSHDNIFLSNYKYIIEDRFYGDNDFNHGQWINKGESLYIEKIGRYLYNEGGTSTAATGYYKDIKTNKIKKFIYYYYPYSSGELAKAPWDGVEVKSRRSFKEL